MTLQKLFSKKKNWTQEAYARNAKGDIVTPLSKDAVCWCLMGAMQKCYPSAKKRFRVLDRIKSLLPGGRMVCFNDRQDQTIKGIRRLVKQANV